MQRIATYPLFLFITLFAGLLLWTTSVSAQLNFGQSAGITLISNPSFPEPNSEVEISIDDFTTNTVGSSIAWYVNGVEVIEGRNERSIVVNSGALGKTQTINARLTRAGVTVSASQTIKPIDISIILESNTYVPTFYKGRALPSSDASIRAIAVVNDGTGISWDTYSYKWILGQNVLSSGAMKGKYAVDLHVPRFDGDNLAVEIYSGNGNLLGKKTITLHSQEPRLMFYEYSPLRGLSERALASTHAVAGETSVIYAEPFFLNVSSLGRTSADFIWKLNNKEVASNSEAQNAVTLGMTGDRASAKVSVTAITKKKMPQFAQDALTVLFE